MQYKVPYIDLPLSFLQDKEKLVGNFVDICTGSRFILRKEVDELEAKIADFLNARYAVTLNSGTDALFLALKALGIGKGDEVITVAHTFVATVAAIVHCGATPVLIDINEDDFTMNPEALEAAITPRTKAVLPVHINGRMCCMSRIREISKNQGLLIIEDAAQAMGSEYNGLMAGTIGNCGCFSFHPMKTLGCFGDGGLLATNDDKLAAAVRSLRNHGQKSKQDITEYGFNSRLDNLQAAILLTRFKKLPELIDRRRSIAARYCRELEEINDLELPGAPDNGIFRDSYSSFVIKTSKRDSLKNNLDKAAIETFIHWDPPLHFHKGLGLTSFTLPITEALSKQILSLPIYPEMSYGQVTYVIKCVQNFFSKENKK